MKEKILRLTLSKEPFQVMVTGEKKSEFRKPSEWIKRRLFNSDGSRKEYDSVEFVNGYGKSKPFFVSIFNGFDVIKFSDEFKYSNGLTVVTEKDDYVIYLGEILRKGNLKSNL